MAARTTIFHEYADVTPGPATQMVSDADVRRLDSGVPLRRPSRIRPIEDEDASDLRAMNASLADQGRVKHDDLMRELGW